MWELLKCLRLSRGWNRMVNLRPVGELLGIIIGSVLSLSVIIGLAHNYSLLNSPITECGGFCEFQFAITESLVIGLVNFLIYSTLTIVSFIFRRRRLEQLRVSTYGGRRALGILGDVGDLDMDTPPTSDASTILVSASHGEKATPSSADYKNPFDF